MHAELDKGEFDESFDVVVAGYGFGGGIAAIEAARRGARVLICEKMPQPGGVSICSGGGVRCALNADDALAYLKATNAGTTPDDLLRVLAEGMASAEAYVKHLSSGVEGTSVKTTEFSGRAGGNYPFPGWKTFFTAQIEVPPTFNRQKLFPSVRTRPSSGGPGLFWVIDNHVGRLGIAAPPSIEKSKLAMWRKAFDTTIKDPGFLADAERLRYDIEPMTGLIKTKHMPRANPLRQSA